MTSAVSVTVLLLFTPNEASGNMPGSPFFFTEADFPSIRLSFL
jgi:hypothetical protein